MNVARAFSKIRRTTPNVARRIIPVLIAGFMATQMAACGSAPKQSEMHTSCSENAHPVWTNDKDASGGTTAMFEYQKSPALHCALVVPAQRYGVTVSVEWSNGWIENLSITDDLRAESGQRYVVLAYEKDKGSAPVTDVKLYGYTSTPAKALLYTVAAPVVAVPLLYSLPASLLVEKRDGPSRPSKNCCYIWVEHGSTGEVLAGTAPLVGMKPRPDPQSHE